MFVNIFILTDFLYFVIEILLSSAPSEKHGRIACIVFNRSAKLYHGKKINVI